MTTNFKEICQKLIWKHQNLIWSIVYKTFIPVCLFDVWLNYIENVVLI